MMYDKSVRRTDVQQGSSKAARAKSAGLALSHLGEGTPSESAANGSLHPDQHGSLVSPLLMACPSVAWPSRTAQPSPLAQSSPVAWSSRTARSSLVAWRRQDSPCCQTEP